MNYAALKAEISKPQYATMSDVEIVDSLNSATITIPCARFTNYRTIASILDDTEYGTLKAVIAALAQQSPRVDDMNKMLALPGDESGNGGGIDFGNVGVRDMLDYLPTIPGLSEEVAGVLTKVVPRLKAIAETKTSWAALNGCAPLFEGNVTSARVLIK